MESGFYSSHIQWIGTRLEVNITHIVALCLVAVVFKSCIMYTINDVKIDMHTMITQPEQTYRCLILSCIISRRCWSTTFTLSYYLLNALFWKKYSRMTTWSLCASDIVSVYSYRILSIYLCTFSHQIFHHINELCIGCHTKCHSFLLKQDTTTVRDLKGFSEGDERLGMPGKKLCNRTTVHYFKSTYLHAFGLNEHHRPVGTSKSLRPWFTQDVSLHT